MPGGGGSSAFRIDDLNGSRDLPSVVVPSGKTVIDQPVAESLGNLTLQGFQFRIDKLDHLAGFDIDHVIVMRLGRRFIAGAAIAEIVAIQNAGLFEQPHGAIDRGDRDPGIERDRPFVELVDVRVIHAFREHPGNDPALLGNTEAAFVAKCFDVDRLVHVRSVFNVGSA